MATNMLTLQLVSFVLLLGSVIDQTMLTPIDQRSGGANGTTCDFHIAGNANKARATAIIPICEILMRATRASFSFQFRSALARRVGVEAESGKKWKALRGEMK